MSKPEVLMFLLLKGASPMLYKGIKSVCGVDFGIPSQVSNVDLESSQEQRPSPIPWQPWYEGERQAWGD
jgi:hypothetical protein